MAFISAYSVLTGVLASTSTPWFASHSCSSMGGRTGDRVACTPLSVSVANVSPFGPPPVFIRFTARCSSVTSTETSTSSMGRFEFRVCRGIASSGSPSDPGPDEIPPRYESRRRFPPPTARLTFSESAPGSERPRRGWTRVPSRPWVRCGLGETTAEAAREVTRSSRDVFWRPPAEKYRRDSEKTRCRESACRRGFSSATIFWRRPALTSRAPTATMGKTTAKKPAGKRPFGTTKGAFGKEGKGAKGSKGGRPLGKNVRRFRENASPPLFHPRHALRV
jgi:hypothetical protein